MNFSKANARIPMCRRNPTDNSLETEEMLLKIRSLSQVDVGTWLSTR